MNKKKLIELINKYEDYSIFEKNKFYESLIRTCELNMRTKQDTLKSFMGC